MLAVLLVGMGQASTAQAVVPIMNPVPTVGVEHLFEASHPDYALPRNAATREVVRDAIYRINSTYTPPHGYGTQAQELVARQQALNMTNPAAQSVRSGFLRAGWRAKVLPRLGALGLGVTAATVGWKVGGAIRSLWIEQEAPARGPFNTRADYTWANFELVPVNGGGFLSGSSGPTAPVDGYVLQYDAARVASGQVFASSNYRQVYHNGCASPSDVLTKAQYPDPPVGASWVASASSCSGTAASHAFAPNVKTTTIKDYEGEPVDAAHTITAPAPPSGHGSDSLIDAAMDEATGDFQNLPDWIDAQLGVPGSSDPVNPNIEMPDCVGLSLAACNSELDAEGFTGTRNVTVLTPEQADLTLPGGAVVRTTPDTHEFALPDTTIEIERNPDELPVVVPTIPTFEDGEIKYGQWEPIITDAGLVPGRVTLTDATLDPNFGPDAVTGSTPAPGTRVQPGTTVTAKVNPETAPTPAGAGGGCTPWVQPAIDLGPLAELEVPDTFPFGVPFWIAAALDEWVGNPTTPEWHFAFPFSEDGFDVSLAMFNAHMPAIRAVLLTVSLLGMAWLFMSAALGFGAGRKED